MRIDESSAENGAPQAPPPTDAAPREVTLAETAAAPAKPRRTRVAAAKPKTVPPAEDRVDAVSDTVTPPQAVRQRASRAKVPAAPAPEVLVSEAAAEPPVSKPRARRPAKPKTVDVPAEAQPEPVAAVVETSDEAQHSPAARSRRRRGGRGRRRPVGDVAALDSTEVEESAEADSVVDIPEAAAEPGEPRAPRRRRGGRGRRRPGEAGAEVSEVQVSAETEELEVATEATPADAKAPRRRRGGRGRKRPSDAAAVGEAADEVAFVTSPEPAATETDGEAKPARKRRTRGRRGASRADESTGADLDEGLDVPALADEVPEAVIAPPQAPKAPKRPEKVKIPESQVARIVIRRGHPELQIVGKTVAPILLFGSVDGLRESRRVGSEIERATQAGVQIYSTLVDLTCPLPPDDRVYDTLDQRLQTLLTANPTGYIIPRIVFAPAPGWREQYPNEVNHYADGTTDDPSISSDRFWNEAEIALQALIEHIERTAYGERVIGYHLERGEWFHPVDGGYDRSYANREAFRQWLRVKYKGSEVALRGAWYDGAVQFFTAEVPPIQTSPRGDVAFYQPRHERQYIDFLEYTSDVTADRLIALARKVKNSSKNGALVSVCYGYTFDFAHNFSGHLALGRLLASPFIDILAGPPSYKDRVAGGSGAFPCPVDSIGLHGKLWITEDDTRSHLASEQGEDYNPRMPDASATEQAHRRTMGASLAHQTGVGYMDLWGEGWLDADDIWKRVGDFRERCEAAIKVRKAPAPEVVVLVDERSLCHVQRGVSFMKRLLHGQRDAALRTGASIGFYLQSDLTAKNFPTNAKLYVFMTPYRLQADQRSAIKEKLQNGGKTLVWTYAAGVCDERGGSEDTALDLVGMTLQHQAWGAETGSKVSDGRHPLTDRLTQRSIGVSERLNPTYYIDADEAGVKVLAEYAASGLPSIATRAFGGWTSIFIGEPTLAPDLLRGLCRAAAVHLYTDSAEDYCWVNHGWLTLHVTRDGRKTIHLPHGCGLYDLAENRLAASDDATEYRTTARAGQTLSYFVGTPEEMRKLALPGTDKKSLQARAAVIQTELAEVPIEPDPPAIEMANALGDVGETEAVEATMAIDGDAAASGAPKRRRRRGGRGRRRPASGETEGAQPTDGLAEDAGD